jgi:hypothetical protein
MGTFIYIFILIINKNRDSIRFYYMTIIWGFPFLSPLYFYQFLFDVLRFLIPSAFIFLYAANSREVQNINYLKVSAIINFVVIGVIFFIPFPIMMINITPLEILISNLFIVAMSIISNLFLLISFGVLILLFGLKNRELYGPYLQFSGIIFIIAFVSRLITVQPLGYSVPYISYIFHLAGITTFLTHIISLILLGPLSMLLIIGMLYLVIHGYKNNEKYVIFAGLSYLISFAFIGYGQIPAQLYVFS